MVKFIQKSKADLPKVKPDPLDVAGFIKNLQKTIDRTRKKKRNEVDPLILNRINQKIERLYLIRDEFKKIRDL